MISTPEMNPCVYADEPEMWWFEWGFEQDAKISASTNTDADA